MISEPLTVFDLSTPNKLKTNCKPSRQDMLPKPKETHTGIKGMYKKIEGIERET